MPSIISATTTNGLSTSADNSGSLQLATNNGTTAMTITTAQKVGIGTTSPSTSLQVSIDGGSGDSAQLFRVTDTNTANGYGPATLTFGNLNHFAPAPTMAIAGTNGISLCVGDGSDLATQRKAMIDSSGNVLVNTTSLNSGKVNIVASGSAQPCMIWNDSDATSGSQGIVSIRRNGSAVGLISTTNTNTTYATSSDYRLKENIAPMTGALATVSALKPVTYKWKSTGEESQGFIAHELQSVVPDCVTGQKDAIETVDDLDKDGKVIGTKEVPKYQGVDTSFLVATLTAAIQELNAKVEAQAVRIAELEGAK